MGKTTIVSLDNKFKRADRVLERYYNIVGMDDIKDIRFEILDPQKKLRQREKAFTTHKKTILALKPLFKQLVIERNRAAEKEGYKNYLEFAANCDGLPKEKFESFLKNVDLATKRLNQKFPKLPPEAASWYWSEYNIPNAPCSVTKKRYTVPDDILKMVEEKAPKVAAIIPKIEIRELDDFYPAAQYDKKKKKVVIFVTARRTSICGAFEVVHELAHALVDFDSLDKGADLLSKSKYWNEREAHKVESKLIKKLFSKKIYDAWLASFLNNFRSTLFEYEIYNHPERNFDRALARANNRCYLEANQRENPFYVLHTYLINRPGYSAMASVAITELLLEKKI